LSSIVCPACKAYLGLSAADAAACPKCATPLVAPRRGPSPEERAAKKQGENDLVHGALWLVGGLVVTGVTYVAAEARGEGYYLLAWGPVVFGGIQFLSGLFRTMFRRSDPAAGSCRECGHSPVEPNAKRCPRCSARDPNPAYFSRYMGRGMLLGCVCGPLAGVVAGLASKQEDAAVFYAIIFLPAGLVVGGVTGLVVGFARWLVRGR
jgi:hypothetical protein